MICLLLCIIYSILFYKQIIKERGYNSFFVGFLSALKLSFGRIFLIDIFSITLYYP